MEEAAGHGTAPKVEPRARDWEAVEMQRGGKKLRSSDSLNWEGGYRIVESFISTLPLILQNSLLVAGVALGVLV
jgi:hypothetical protein